MFIKCRQKSDGFLNFVHLLLVLLVVLALSPGLVAAEDLASCTAQVSNDFSGGFSSDDFDATNVIADSDGVFSLATGFQSINPEEIVIPFEQEVWVSFFYEDAGYTSTLGWMLKDDAVDDSGNFLGWNSIPSSVKHPIFGRVSDGSGGGDGILDVVSGLSETGLALYNDPNAEGRFIVDGDGAVTPKDMKKSLGTFAAGTELVFWLANNNGSWNPPTGGTTIFYNRTGWNPDTYGVCTPASGDARWLDVAETEFYRTYELGSASSGDVCTMSKGFLDQRGIDRLQTVFSLTMGGNYDLTIPDNDQFPHVIVAAPDQDPNQWILSWEDLPGGGDMDYNDITFRIERKTGGAIEVKDTSAITPSNPESFYTSVNFGVYDDIPGGTCDGKVEIDYFVSIDNGSNWLEVRDWDTAQEYAVDADGNKNLVGSEISGASWTAGSPQLTYRTRRIDFSGENLVGRELVWKAFLKSDAEACVPRVVGATIDGNTQSHDTVSRTSPIKLANLLYTGSYETPAIDWTDKETLRGHVKATRLYYPQYPDVADTPDSLYNTVNLTMWDAGERLQYVLPEDRNIIFPNITTHTVVVEALDLTTPDETVLSAGDATTTVYKGQLANAPLIATTVRIAAGPLNGAIVFQDEGTDILTSIAGAGTINRFTGEFEITFDSPPDGLPFVASYSWYETAAQPLSFNATNINNTMLAIDDTPIIPTGFKYDFDGDDSFDEDDGDWLVDWIRGYEDGSARTTQKSWKLGPIDHSVPAILTPPGYPEWYFGTAVTQEMKDSYDTFRSAQEDRDTVLFVGSRSGMLHAFDAGKFRYGDNPLTTLVTEVQGRGYFLWEDADPDPDVVDMQPNYGSGDELWAFIPANLIPRLKNNLMQGDDQSYIDASPSLAQVRFGSDWKSVVLSAQGNGGDSVFCLDVTDPDNPQFLWEFADPDLFRSRSSPAIGQIGLVMVDGAPKWAAFFVSGKSDPGSYPSVYVIDITNGSVIERIFLDSETEALGGTPSGQPAIVDTDDNGYVDRIYVTAVASVTEGGVTRDKGFLYKVNLPDDPLAYWEDAAISNVVVNGDFIDDDGDVDGLGNLIPLEVPVDQRWHPIYASPTVVVDNVYDPVDNSRERLVRLFFGTGDSPYYDENINEGNTKYHFFAYIDRAPKSIVSPVQSVDPNQVELDWFFELPAGQRIFATAFASAGKVYFGTSGSETENPCEGDNDGRIYAFDLTGYNGGTPLTPSLNEEVGNTLSAPLVDDRQLFIVTNKIKKVGDNKYNNPLDVKGFGEAKPSSWREVLD